MRSERVIVVGASAGGVEALRALVGGLPPDLAAAVVVVLHIPRTGPSMLAEILNRAGPLPTVAARDTQHIRAGTVYVAPADHHVLVSDGMLRLSTGPAENGHRPAIDPLFRSAAIARGHRVIGVILSGTRDDGAAGLAMVVARGGTAVVQDPTDSVYPAMPQNALRLVPTAAIHPAAKIGGVLGELTRAPVIAGPLAAAPAADEQLVAEHVQAIGGSLTSDLLPQAQPSPFSCPSCHGVLFALPGEPHPRFRCRVGHAWSPATLAEEQTTAAEDALWVAIRALEEKAALADQLSRHAERNGHRRSSSIHRARAIAARAQADQVRSLLPDAAEVDDVAP